MEFVALSMGGMTIFVTKLLVYWYDIGLFLVYSFG